MDMLFLTLLESNLTDQELFELVNAFEVECLFADVTDEQVLLDVLIVEEQLYIDSLWDSLSNMELFEVGEMAELWGSDSNSQVLQDAIAVEDQAEISSGLSDSQLLHDVTVIESSLNHLLGESAPQPSSRNFSAYQGPQMPMPTLTNNVVFTLIQDRVQCKPVSNLGFVPNFGDHDESLPAVSQAVPNISHSMKKIFGPAKPVRQYNHPREDSQMESLGF